jgi:hypothetical protein
MSFAEILSQIRWRPRIGDPSIMGWLTVAAYGATALLCLVAALRGRNADGREARARRRMWLGVAALMALLCVNKQLDLQSLFTDLGRLVASSGGWYEQRRAVQRLFVITVAAAGALALYVAVRKIRSLLRDRILLVLGLCSLVTFIVIRAASFHHLDVIIRSQILGIRVNWILELGGIALVALGATQSLRDAREGSPAEKG